MRRDARQRPALLRRVWRTPRQGQVSGRRRGPGCRPAASHPALAAAGEAAHLVGRRARCRDRHAAAGDGRRGGDRATGQRRQWRGQSARQRARRAGRHRWRIGWSEWNATAAAATTTSSSSSSSTGSAASSASQHVNNKAAPKVTKVIAQKAAASASKVLGAAAPKNPTVTTGQSCTGGAGCQNGKFTGNFFGQ